MQPSPTTLTAGHRKLHAVLTSIGLICEDEAPSGRYFLDIYNRDYHLAFEFDGELHQRRKQRRHDHERDAWLLDIAGIPVMRVDDRLLRDVDLEQAIQDFVILHCETLAERVKKRDQWPVG